MSKPKAGDKVKLMDDTAVYTVVRCQKGNIVIVKTDDGLEIPLREEDIIVTVVKPGDLIQGSSSRVIKKPDKSEKKSPVIKAEKKKERIVDLHVKGNFNGDNYLTTIDVQMLKFVSELDAAIRDGYREITFIHGVGSGKLKNEIRRVLSERYTSCTFQDAPYSKYGIGGATLVLISNRY